MLKLVDISKEYRIDDTDVTVALKNVSIEFRQNEFVSILGPSGCGKTTLLNIIGGLDRYNSGDIKIEGISTKEYDDVDWDTYRNQRIGFVFQSYNLIPHMSILKNVALCLTLAGVSKEERNERALEALRKVGLDSQAKKRPNQLSGGQMQRVAIARALVNNPDIILADEPTGALDTESGLQIMELLKEVASDRLVIMVTHNPQLAEEYSTRIVYLKDGEVVDDTMPYDGSVEDEIVVDEVVLEETEAPAIEETDVLVADRTEEAEIEPIVEETAEKKQTAGRRRTLKERIAKYLAHDKSSMKLSTAISLSWNNLISKKGRTLLTSIAGSIGIIGIILVLALSSGAKMFLSGIEENSLSTYPLTVSKSTMDVTEILNVLMSGGKKCEEHVDKVNEAGVPVMDNYCDECGLKLRDENGKPIDYDIIIQSVLGSVVDRVFNAPENDLHAFKQYIEDNFDDELASVKYNYGTTFNAYCVDPKNGEVCMKVNPYVEAMVAVLEDLPLGDLGEMEFGTDMSGNPLTLESAMSTYGSMLGNSWVEMTTNQKLLDEQYDVRAGRWPSSKDEIVIVLDSDGKLMDIQLFMLGLKSKDDIMEALDGKTFTSEGYSFEELLKMEYQILTNADYLVKNVDENGYLLDSKGGRAVDKDGNPVLVANVDTEGYVLNAAGNRIIGADDKPIAMTWSHAPKTESDKDFIDEHASMSVKVVGIVQPKPDAVAASINGVIGYTKELSDYLLKKAESHPGVVQQSMRYKEVEETGGKYQSVLSYSYKEGNDKNVKIGQKIEADDHAGLMRALGSADLDYPISISFYCSSFASKEGVEEFIAEYNNTIRQHNEQVEKDFEAGLITREEWLTLTKDELQYTDTLSTVMGLVNTMTNVITGVLIAFASISLIVSTIMIAIIIYTSVLERRKEIGVLRSIGARKKDVARVFLAESAILGGYSGLIGVFVSWLMSLGISALLECLIPSLVGIMTVEWWHAVMMLGISILLSMLAGFIPSRIAAKKDPAIALRS